MPRSEDLKAHRYLGDAVYASFDGFHVWLHLNDHRSEPVIALEPSVLTALNAYYTEVRKGAAS